MTNRERTLAALNYEKYDRLPCVAFGYWNETVEKWEKEGYISRADAESCTGDNSPGDLAIMAKLGFDFNWTPEYVSNNSLFPAFETEVLETFPDGRRRIRDGNGLIVEIKPGLSSIPSMVGTTLTGREAWETLYLPKLRYSEERIDFKKLERISSGYPGEAPLGIFVGSYIGVIRDFLGVEEFSYLYADDIDLYAEIIDTVCEISYRCTERILRAGARFDFAHFWEDICFKNGPLVIPSVFERLVCPHYKKITELLKSFGIGIVSLDCDGKIDALIPGWIENGVNTMFPIEVGTWNASIAPWREKYGKRLRGVGGMDKRVFSKDKAAVDAEIERLKPLVALGGYIPCPDHRIPPDAKFENVAYYCERFHREF